ncbi:MAG: hypothetical protein V1754_09055 [Pseudomonadota bacterium]
MRRTTILVLEILLLSAFFPGSVFATSVIGMKVRVGGRYDNVRMCVATDAGVKGGPAMDIALFAEMGLSKNWSIDFDLPVLRPLLFDLAFDMLQFEPEAAFLYRKQTNSSMDMVFGPTLGVSLHYGPDYTSAKSGDSRGPAFFAMGPQLGAYFGLDFKRPGKAFNFQLGLHPYVTPLFAIDDPKNHRGVVVGGLLDLQVRFALDK